MRKSILLFLIIWVSNFLVYAQDQPRKEKKFSPGISYSTFGKYEVSRLMKDENYPKFSSNSFYSLGISSFFRNNKIVKIESGIYYSKHSINIDKPYPSPPDYTTNEKIELIEFPVNVRFDFPYFYISSGLLLDFQLNSTDIIDGQTGIGFNMGIGASYKFKFGLLVYAGPIAYIHSIFSQDILSGISLKIGVAFN
jgi:hypothetical protein